MILNLLLIFVKHMFRWYGGNAFLHIVCRGMSNAKDMDFENLKNTLIVISENELTLLDVK